MTGVGCCFLSEEGKDELLWAISGFRHGKVLLLCIQFGSSHETLISSGSIFGGKYWPGVIRATTIIMDDQREARKVARPWCVQRLVEKSHAPYLQAAGIDTNHLEVPVNELSQLYPDIPHAEDWERAQQLCAFLPEEVLARMCDAIGLIGTPDYCAQRIRQAEADGIGHLYLMTSESYRFPERELAAFRDKVLPALTPA